MERPPDEPTAARPTCSAFPISTPWPSRSDRWRSPLVRPRLHRRDRDRLVAWPAPRRAGTLAGMEAAAGRRLRVLRPRSARVLGGRIGYVLFYDFSRFVSDPLVLVRIWEGGMSFHGGLLGSIAAIGALRAPARTRVLPGRRLLRPPGATGARSRSHRQLRQRRALGQARGGPLGDGLSPAPGPRRVIRASSTRRPSRGSSSLRCCGGSRAAPGPAWPYRGSSSSATRRRGASSSSPASPMHTSATSAFGWVTTGQLLSVPMLVAGAAMLWWGGRRAGEAS